VYCKNCGAQIPEGASFCGNCGAPLDVSQERIREMPQSPAQPPQVPQGGVPPVMQQAAYAPQPSKRKSGKTIGIIAGIIAILIIVAVVLSLVFFVFKGDDTGKAKEYVKKADAIAMALEPKGQEIGNNLSALGQAMEGGRIQSSDQYESEANPIRTATAELLDKIKDVKDEYKKVEDLEGVDDYKEYAKTRMEQADHMSAMMHSVNEMLDYISKLFVRIESGQVPDESEISSNINSFVEQISNEQSKIEELDKEAKSLKKELKI